MKKILYNLTLVMLVFFVSCEGESTGDVSRITFFNDIELVGAEIFIVEQGSSYSEPGAIASEAETDVTDQIVISGVVDTSSSGHYLITYNIANKDGFEKSITRHVFVLPTDRSKSEDYVGTYTGDVSNGTFSDATNISHLGDGLYYADDFIGGRYVQGRGLPPIYKITAYFYVSGDGTTYEALLTDSPWGPWGVLNPTLNGTTFTHDLQSGTFQTPVVLIKQ
ncbi:hypothetical protein GCM10023314_22580 [Algibacter agarivorans]|uniref:Pesticidal crystal protein Cry22Aa Ig-like domain-containing protein n=1 Tax=Algibacter agarivorans TaxID=1109741 RepID=A0ABP9GV84_9FLAO